MPPPFFFRSVSVKNTPPGIYSFCMLVLLMTACQKQSNVQPPPPPADSSIVNTSHLDYLYTPVTFSTGTKAAGIFIYSNAPDYKPVEATGEGYTCVDDVARAVLVYARSKKFSTDTAVQEKVYNLISFLLEMQSPAGYFYNFIFTNNLINTSGATSMNTPNWWSWRALQALTETMPLIKNKNVLLSAKMDPAISKLVDRMKTDFIYLPATTTIVNGITIPQWLPEGSGTDQSATLILGLIPYCISSGDTSISVYIKKLADGMVSMQQGDAGQYPYSCFLSWENQWHAYGNDQSLALLKAGVFLQDTFYTSKALSELDNFYPWLLQNGLRTSFSLSKSGNQFQLITDIHYPQIAYGIRPMVFAAIEAFQITGLEKYADLAGHLSAWFSGANDAGLDIYFPSTGICYDGLTSSSAVNINSGAESTIEALLTFQRVENFPAVLTAYNKYRKH